ncbi:MAG: hypothetical protein E7623_04665 [Ruminococcaceae bacterium]|nr:hypothetical protein [Oscillospiraceae bacterium]
MKKYMLRILCFLLAGMAIFSSCGTETDTLTETETASETERHTETEAETETKAPEKYEDWTKYGLQVDEDGVIRLDGEAYYAMGVNFHGPVSMSLGGIDLDPYFKTLADNGIPYCRIQFGVFYANEVIMAVNERNRNYEAFYKAMDDVVATAEKYNIGLIASLFWNLDAYATYAKESLDALNDPESRTMGFISSYITKVVGKYKESPAIWAWEIGNEGNLSVDLNTSVYEGSDGTQKIITTDLLTKYYELVGEMIRKEDPYRMITGGDAAPRGSSMALYNTKGGSWSPANSYDDFKTAFQWYTPEPLDTISLHYADVAMIKKYVKMAKELKIGLFIGEFHAGDGMFENPLDALSAEDSSKEAREQKKWLEYRNMCKSAGVQLATAWCYGRYIQQSYDPTTIEYGMVDGIYQNVHMFEGLIDINKTYREQGKQNTSVYWEKTTALVNTAE